MSTKTTLKRIALVAVSTLGFGLLSVVPSGAVVNPTVGTPTVGTKAQTTSVGTLVSTTVGFSFTQNVGIGDDWGGGANTVGITFAAPATSLVTLDDNDGAGAGTASAYSATGATTGLGQIYTTTAAVPAAPNTGTLTATNPTVAFTAPAAVVAGTISIKPDVPGLYQVWITAGGTTAYSYIYAWTSAVNGATLVGVLGDGGFPSNNAAINGVAGPANTVTVRAFPSTTVRRLITVDGAGAYISGVSASAVGATLAAGTNPTSATIASNAYAATSVDTAIYSDFIIATPTAGTVTMKIFSETGVGSGIFSATAAGTVTITVGATGSAGTLSVSLSTVRGTTDNTAAATAATDLAVPSSILGTGASSLKVRYDIKVRDVLGAFRNSSTTSLTATVEGPGLLNTTSSTTGLARVVVIPWDTTYVVTNDPVKNTLFLFNDGTAGKSTVTIYWGSTVLATKTVTFTGAPKTLEATAFEPHITVGTSDFAIEIIAKDALGNVTPYTPTTLSSAPTVVSGALDSCYVAVAADALDGLVPGANYCGVTGVSVGTASLTIAPGSLTTNSPVVDFRVTKAKAANVTLTSDKATYAPGEKITLTLTVKDADGFLLGSKASSAKYSLLSGDLSTTISMAGTPFCGSSSLTTTCKKSDGLIPPTLIPNPGVSISAGTAKTSYFAPLVSGPVTFSATVSGADVETAYLLTPIKLTVTVDKTSAELAAEAAADAAAEAIDAANAATDAANLAAEAADAATVAAEEARDAADAATAAIEELATQVATLMAALKAQITTLANTVAKIAKKVRA